MARISLPGSGLRFDRSLVVVTLLLLCLSVVLISSASVMEASVRYADSMYLVKKHLLAVAAALLAALVTAAVPTEFWKKYSIHLMAVMIILLILVLLLGRNINEARRWLSLGFFNLQPAELLKLCWIFYFSSYVSRKSAELRTFKGFLKPLIFIGIFGFLLLMQPDFGSMVVITMITFCMLWIAGVRIFHYLAVGALLAVLSGLMVVIEPYRMRRVTSFLNPWQDQFGSGYQLTQSLMAFGRGGLFGEGLGNSIQKMGYLPEAHTDFVTAVLGEELGFAGMCVMIFLEFFIVVKALRLAFRILHKNSIFQGYVVLGIGVWFCLQTFINIGAASGALPTKGLTLPLISYGGSSLLVCCCAIAVLLRVDYEYRLGLIGKKETEAERIPENIWGITRRS